MSQARSVNATFTTTSVSHDLTVTKDGTGGGNVTSSPAGIDCGSTCVAAFDEDTDVTLTATPNGSSTFDGWSGAGCTGTGTCQVTMSQARSVNATFTTTFAGSQPDALVAKAKTGPFKGDDLYNGNAAGQTLKKRAVRRSTSSFFVRIQNEGADTDSFTLEGPGALRGLRVKYFLGRHDITRRVVAGTYRIVDLAAGQSRQIRMTVLSQERSTERCLGKMHHTSAFHDSRSQGRSGCQDRRRVGLSHPMGDLRSSTRRKGPLRPSEKSEAGGSA